MNRSPFRDIPGVLDMLNDHIRSFKSLLMPRYSHIVYWHVITISSSPLLLNRATEGEPVGILVPKITGVSWIEWGTDKLPQKTCVVVWSQLTHHRQERQSHTQTDLG